MKNTLTFESAVKFSILIKHSNSFDLILFFNNIISKIELYFFYVFYIPISFQKYILQLSSPTPMVQRNHAEISHQLLIEIWCIHTVCSWCTEGEA